MKQRIQNLFEESIDVKRRCLETNADFVAQAIAVIETALGSGKKLLIFGNGGSAADSQHIAAEFVGRFQRERRALAAVALTTDTSIITALANDYSFDMIFSRQIEALGQPGDVAWGISTSGNSPNVLEGLAAARERGMKTIAMMGGDGGKMKSVADINLVVPSKNTARIQESHICMSHIICQLVEEAFAESD